MNILNNIEMGIQNLKANKLRSFLTMLGIIIGISSVIAIMTVGNSLSGSLTNSLSSLGISNISVSLTNKDSSKNSFRMFMRESYKESDLMSQDMIDEYKTAYADYLDYVILTEKVGSTTVTNADKEADVSIIGVTKDYEKYEDIQMITGRYISDEDNDNKEKFCIVSDQFINDLGYSELSSVGLPIKITVNGFLQEFTIIGIYKYQSETSQSFNNSSSIVTDIYIPLNTAKYLLKSKNGFSSFTVVSKVDIDTSWFLDQTQSFFESYYTQNDSYTVNASNMEAMLETVTEMLSTVTLAISCIAAISLLVGGIGVMNIMLVSVTERTKEIGIRKALGATQNAIRLQFIIEAIIVCLIGGIIGIIIGLLAGSIGVKVLGYAASPSVLSIFLSVAFSVSIGVFFGYYPANKAAKLNPIEALGFE